MKIPQKPPEVVLHVPSMSHKELEELFRAKEAVKSPLVGDDYVHWDKLRHLAPPGDFSRESWWRAIKFIRHSIGKTMPFVDKAGKPFYLSTPDPAHELFHQITLQAAGPLEGAAADPRERDAILLRSSMEEAISSSQLEGASTTRKVARELLRSGRRPRDRSERMIVNNFLTMQKLRGLKDQPLTVDLLLELHRTIADQNVDPPDGAGRLRRADEDVRVEDRETGDVVHVPPDAGSLRARLKALCDFANGVTPKEFIHPVARSIVLHFMLAYDHPFVDGNGRCARALFYWSMIRQGYWLAGYLSISRLLLKAPAQYARAYLLTETDENDITYFLMFHLDILKRALEDLRQDVATRARERNRLLAESRLLRELNYRQRDAVVGALKDPAAEITVKGHQRTHGTAYGTARSDLLDLVRRGLFQKTVRGTTQIFWPAKDLGERLGKQAPTE